MTTRDMTWIDVNGYDDLAVRSDERGHQVGCANCGWRSEWYDLREDAQADAEWHTCDDEADEA